MKGGYLMNDLQIFKNNEFGEIRTALINNEPYLMLNDICRILDIKNASDTKSRLNKDGVGTTEVIDSLGRKQQATFINESNFYKVVFQSRKPEAERFTEWVTSEVLPTIRKTGGYVANDELFIQTYLPHADEQTKLMFRTTLFTVRKLNEEKALMQPKADYFDALVERNLLTNFRDTAKGFKIKERIFIEWLEDKKFIYRDIKNKIKPYAKYAPDLFEIKEWTRNDKTGNQTLITPKGRETFRLLLIKDGLVKGAS
jgi:prophage antirepressor-like protein